MQLMCVCIYIYILYIYIYILLTSILQVILSRYFTLFFSSRFLFDYLFLKSHAQRNIKSVINIVYILYTLSFCYVNRVLKICTGGHFLEDCFYYYSQQIILL